MTLLSLIILAPFVVLTLAFAMEVFVGLVPLPSPTLASGETPRAIIIVPAHDEEPVLSARLEQLKAAAAGRASLLLVADNCSDSTADIGRSLGVEVIERIDGSRRGKGFALDFARRHLDRDPPDVVLIVDADCAIDAESIKALIKACAASGRPCQATNLQVPPVGGSPAVQLSTFAFYIKNVVRQRALQRLAGRVHLLGTGMALPWSMFAGAKLATSDIVEDLKLGQELASAGHAPMFIERATVLSNAETDRNTLSQRRRWEGGFLQNAFRAGPPAFARSLIAADLKGLWAAIDTMVPPFALLILVDLFALLSIAAFSFLTGTRAACYLLTATLLLCGIALILAWATGGRRFVSLSGLMRAPFYVAWKLPMYLAFALRGAPKEWQRTDRS